MRLLLVLTLAGQIRATAENFPFAVRQESEVIADLEMSSPGSDWSKPGRQAALAVVRVDGKSLQHVMLYAGGSAHTYSAFLGSLTPGKHELSIRRSSKYSARGSGLAVHRVSFHEISPNDPQWSAIAHAPLLFAGPTRSASSTISH